jgi:hypothetical protein
MSIRSLGLSACLVIASGLSLHAGATFYAVSFDTPNGVFGTIDPLTGIFTQIGGPLPGHSHDVTVAPDGTVYSVVDSNLDTIDKTTGLATVVGALPPNVQSLAFRADGTLFGASFSDLFIVNRFTGAGIDLGAMGLGANADNIRFGGGTLYVMSAETNSRLLTVNQTTGATTVVGSSGLDDISLGTFLGGTFYGTNQVGGVTDHIVTVNPSTGVGTEGVTTNDIYLFALDPTSVPEPATLLLLGGGFGLLALRRYRDTRAG